MSETTRAVGTIDSCAICLYFDAETDATIRRIWEEMTEAKISSEMADVGWRPHVTLTGCRDLRLEDYLPRLQEFAASIELWEFAMTSVGYFGGEQHTLFLTPTVTRRLLDLQERHHRWIVPSARPYRPTMHRTTGHHTAPWPSNSRKNSSRVRL